MNVIDIGIIILLIFGALQGLKRGFTKQLVSALGFILVVILSFYLKNPISILLYQNLPFFSFWGIFKGVTVLNIVVYELVAFLLVFSVLMILLKVLLLATSIFEKILTMTIILGIPSKIMGAIIGVIQYYIIAFIVLYILSFPGFNNELVMGSSYRTKILNNTPVLSQISDRSVSIVNEFASLKKKYETANKPEEFNLEALDLLLKYKVVEVKSIDKLVEKGKLNINYIDRVLNKYR